MYWRKVVTLLDLLSIYRQFVVYVYIYIVVLINTTLKLLSVANFNLPVLWIYKKICVSLWSLEIIIRKSGKNLDPNEFLFLFLMFSIPKCLILI